MHKPVVLSMDIGGTNIRMATVSEDGTVIAMSNFSCRISEGRTAFLETIKTELELIQNSAKKTGLKIVALGAGVPGLIDIGGTIISSVNLRPINDFNLRQWLESVCGLPSTILNDANAAAVAEHQYGAGRPFSSILHFTLGTGVGSGLILNDKLWTGKDGIAAEYGHATVEPAGYPCQCGNHGCLEQYSSATAIAKLAREDLSIGTESSLAAIPIEKLTACNMASAAFNGDALAIKCFSEAGRYLGIAAANAVNMLNLEAIIVGGGVAESFNLIGPEIRKEIDQRAFRLPASRVKVLKGELDDRAGIMGAAAAAWELAKK